jgi:hypothetical protein
VIITFGFPAALAAKQGPQRFRSWSSGPAIGRRL